MTRTRALLSTPLVLALVGTMAALPAHAATPQAPPPDQVWLISRALDGSPGRGGSSSDSMSGDGRYVLIDSTATDLVADDTNRAYDVFLHDRADDSTVRVSLAFDGGQTDGDCYGSRLSADGGTAVFGCRATNVIEGEIRRRQLQIYHRDLATGVTRLVSAGLDGKGGNGHPQYPVVSGDGRYVVYSSDATNLVPGDDNRRSDVFLWDAATGRTTVISANPDGEVANGSSGSPSITEDGTVIAFDSDATDLTDDATGGAHVFLWRDGEIELVSRDRRGRPALGYSPMISPDGGHIGLSSTQAYTKRDLNEEYDAYLLNLGSGRTRLISATTEGYAGNQDSHILSVSAHARAITFGTWSTDFVEGDDDITYDAYVRDRTHGLLLLNERPDGTIGDGGAQIAGTDRRGRVVVFSSYSSDLVEGDDNQDFDAFLYRLPRD